MGHWADRYVGLPFKAGGRSRAGLDCFGLVRLVLAERAGLHLPSYSSQPEAGDGFRAHFARVADGFETIAIDETEELDAVIMLEDVRLKSGWVQAPVHIGLVVAPRQVLHIRRDCLSCVEPFEMLRLHSAKRGPAHAR